MRKHLQQFVVQATAIFLLVLFAMNSQAQQAPAADNSVHDRMYNLMQKSEKVALPQEVTDHINVINKDNPYKVKVIYAQTSLLKVLYNKALSKDDIRFFGKELLKNNSDVFTPIHSDIKKLLAKL